MKRIIGFCLIIVAATLPVAAKTLRISAPILSGHFDKNGVGRSAAALEAIFHICGIRPEFELKPWGQHWLAYERDPDLDAVAIVWESAGINGFPSAPFIHQKNGVAFLAAANLKIRSVSDLKGLRVLGFGGATQMFPSLAAVLPDLKSYWEAPSGFSTTQALINKDVDVFITDGLIFAIDYKLRAKATGGTYGDSNWPKVKFVGLFPENADTITFRHKEDRDNFNRCHDEAVKSGALAKATKPYIDPYRDILGDQIPAE
ncbi:hypothetical protein [Kordiimonas marina]|uniref:hypothetical protein n=1 Tax=Kordiimonas marina TaxID=2872312 RepID=UPI001FF1F8CC|nr:hypothetical protein [Kordiimonas marina]MCJ9430125.1 hypothetical protein [Kordiimonas marina]